MIKRHLKTVIDNSLKHFPVIFLTGLRQVGKSTFLYNEYVNKGYNYVS